MPEQFVPCRRLLSNGRTCTEPTIPQVTPNGVTVLWCPACATETPIPRRYVLAGNEPRPTPAAGADPSELAPVICVRCLQPRPVQESGLCKTCARRVEQEAGAAAAARDAARAAARAALRRRA